MLPQANSSLEDQRPQEAVNAAHRENKSILTLHPSQANSILWVQRSWIKSEVSQLHIVSAGEPRSTSTSWQRLEVGGDPSPLRKALLAFDIRPVRSRSFAINRRLAIVLRFESLRIFCVSGILLLGSTLLLHVALSPVQLPPFDCGQFGYFINNIELGINFNAPLQRQRIK